MAKKTTVAIAGINGQMGRASAIALLDDPEIEITGAIGRPDASYVGQDIGALINKKPTGIKISTGLEQLLSGKPPDVVLDFSIAEAAFDRAIKALKSGISPIIGSSGLSQSDLDFLENVSLQQKIGAMVVPNFSIGAVLMMEFAGEAGKFFSNVEIVEMHHTKKIDAPSGTALHTARKLATAGKKFNRQDVNERELLPGARGAKFEDSGLRIHSVRLPGLISRQEVLFGSDGELFKISHDSLNTNCFVGGILMSVKAVRSFDHLVIGLEHLLR